MDWTKYTGVEAKPIEQPKDIKIEVEDLTALTVTAQGGPSQKPSTLRFPSWDEIRNQSVDAGINQMMFKPAVLFMFKLCYETITKTIEEANS